MSKVESRYASLVEVVAGFLLILYPGAMFAVKGGMNGSFLLLLLTSLAVFAVRPRTLAPVVWNRDMTHYLASMSALTIAIFLSQAYHHHYSGHPYDGASRFWLAVPVFLVLQRMRFSVVTLLQYGMPLATIIGLVFAGKVADGSGRLLLDNMDLIHFGDFELMLGVLSLLSINWAGRDKLSLLLLKMLGFAIGVYVSLKTGSRGGWVALPVFALIYMRFRTGRFSLKALTVTFVAVALLSLPVYVFNHKIHERIDQVGRDLAAFNEGNPDSDTGIRLQIYKAATVIFIRHPVFGVGPEGFALEMEPMARSGEISRNAAELGRGEVHNELLSKSAELGVFGLIALLSAYLLPLRMFYRSMCSNALQVRQSGMLGLVFVSGFMVFGLTVEVLNLTMAAAFYSLTVAVLLAACLNIHHGEQNSPDTL